MLRSKLRSPASTCPRRAGLLLATSEPASTVLVSPWTSTVSGMSDAKIRSMPASMAPVWAPWSPEPTLSVYFGSGSRRSSKKTRSMEKE